MPETVCRVLDLLVTEQVEDPHVDYAVEDLRWTREVGLGVVAKDDSGQGLVVCGAQLSWSDARNEIVGFSRVLVSLSGPLWV